MELLSTVPLLIIDDLGMRKLPLTAAEELLEIIMRRYERASTLVTSNRPVDDWGKLLGDSAAVSAMLDRLLHHGHVLKCGPRSWRTQRQQPRRSAMKAKAIRMPGKERPAASQSRIQRPPTTELHHKNAGKTRNPLTASSQAKLQRVSIADSSGASPVSSALDHSARRDPGGANITLTRIPAVEHQLPPTTPCKAHAGKVKQSRLRPISMAGFKPITYGRI